MDKIQLKHSAANIGSASGVIRAGDEFFAQPTAEVARALIGAHMVFRPTPGVEHRVRIVETEAYLAEGDRACHAYRGMTQRNSPMFENAGILYVYSIYGIHRCMNVVTETRGRGCAVLLRAAEYLQGSLDIPSGTNQALRAALLRGPAKLCKSIGIGLEHNGQSCTSATLWFELHSPSTTVVCSPRIGISSSLDLPLRFFDAESPSVSGRIKKGTPVYGVPRK